MRLTVDGIIHKTRDKRKGGRAVECTGLENRQGFAPFVGSNPTLSAIFNIRHSQQLSVAPLSHD